MAPTINRDLSLLSSIFRRAITAGLAVENPVRGISRQREPLKPIPLLGEEQIDQLVAANDPEFGGFLRFQSDAGTRLSETQRLTWEDIDFARRVVVVKQSKTGQPREVPMTAKVEALLLA